MARRWIAGVVLIGLGLGLLGSQLPITGERLVIAVVALAAWVGAGIGVIAGRTAGRYVGLVVAGVGFVVAAFAAYQANSGQARLFADAFFLTDGPNFSWFEVAFGAIAFAALSALAGLLLIRPPRAD